MLTLLATLIIFGIMALGAAGIFVFFYALFFGKRDAEKAEAKYQEELPERFDGTNTVVWDISLTNTGTPKKEQLIQDAQDYGYDLDHISTNKVAQTLVFKRKSNINLIDRVAPYMDEK
jgi:hypothetical protein